MIAARGVILCAGASARMGRPKALLPLEDGTFLSRVVNALDAGGVSEISVVVGGEHQAAVEETIQGLRGRHPRLGPVINPDPSPGPISSVRAALAELDLEVGDVVLIHPVDIPGVEARDIVALLHAADEYPEADAIIPSVGMRRAHPVVLRSRLARRVFTLTEKETLRDLFSSSGVSIHHVVCENDLLLNDVDTPADYRELCERLHR